MLKKIGIQIPKLLIEQAINELPSSDFRYAINKPTGDFFYDNWELKAEYKDTVWENLLSYLPNCIGEARIILLDHSKCYQMHADIDDRYHLNLSGTDSFLIDLQSNKMYPLIQDGYWYEMNAGSPHSAVNFGRTVRAQLVVRSLLNRGILNDPVLVKISFENLTPDHARFIFDNTLSPFLNKVNKQLLMDNFTHSKTQVSFTLDKSMIDQLQNTLPKNFKIDYDSLYTN
jgi:hypothetical protein